MANTWMNKDGLYVKFGTAQADLNNGGEYCFDGPNHLTEVKIDLTTLASTATIVSDTVFFPKSARLEKIEIVTSTAATSAGAATLDIGLVQNDRSTEIDANGFVAALAKTSVDASGETTTITAGGTGAGALVGVTNTTSGYITANYGTAAFTAGVIYVRLFWRAV